MTVLDIDMGTRLEYSKLIVGCIMDGSNQGSV